MTRQKTLCNRKRVRLSPVKYRQLCEYVYERDQFCLICGRSDMSTPQHVQRRSQGGPDSPRNVVRLCVICHDLMDQYKIDLPDSVYEMLDREPETL